MLFFGNKLKDTVQHEKVIDRLYPYKNLADVISRNSGSACPFDDKYQICPCGDTLRYLNNLTVIHGEGGYGLDCGFLLSDGTLLIYRGDGGWFATDAKLNILFEFAYLKTTEEIR